MSRTPPYTLHIQQGATFNKAIRWRAGTAYVDLTGASAKAQFRKDYDSANTILDLSSSNGGLIIDGPNGRITFNITASQSAALPPGQGVWDLEVTIGDNVTNLIGGIFTVRPEVTKDD